MMMMMMLFTFGFRHIQRVVNLLNKQNQNISTLQFQAHVPILTHASWRVENWTETMNMHVRISYYVRMGLLLIC